MRGALRELAGALEQAGRGMPAIREISLSNGAFVSVYDVIKQARDLATSLPHITSRSCGSRPRTPVELAYQIGTPTRQSVFAAAYIQQLLARENPGHP